MTKPKITLDGISDDTPMGLILLRLCQEVSLTDPNDATKYISPWTLINADNDGLHFVHDHTGESVIFRAVILHFKADPESTAQSIRAANPEAYDKFMEDLGVIKPPLVVERAEVQEDGTVKMVKRFHPSGAIVQRAAEDATDWHYLLNGEPAEPDEHVFVPADPNIKSYTFDVNQAGLLRTHNWGDDNDPQGATLNDDITPS